MQTQPHGRRGPRIVLMGVSGAGKSTVGPALAKRLGLPFLDADDFHSAGAKAKMAAGTPLTDQDREPWIQTLSHELEARAEGVVLACSALTRRYRAALDTGDVFFVHLTAPRDSIDARLRSREEHFMPPAMLDSQLALLEPLTHDEHGVTINADAPIGDVVNEAARLAAERTTPSLGAGRVLDGRNALVTGSSRGIGRSIAAGLIDAGAHVILHGREQGRLEATRAAFVEQYGSGRVDAVHFDITDDRAVVRSVQHVEETIGPIDILVNNAGVQHRVPMLDLDVDDWERVIRTDLTGPFLVGREVARHMVQRRRGKIINIASVQTDLARPTIAAYTAAKGGIRNLTRAMTAEWAEYNIQINALAPGYIHTEMTQALVDDNAFNTWILGRTPAARWGTPDDLVGPAVWLASPGSDFVNGQVVFVDGGMTVVV